MRPARLLIHLFWAWGFLPCASVSQNDCASAVSLLPGQVQCGNTLNSGDGVDSDDCLGVWDEGNDYFFSFSPTPGEQAWILYLELGGQHDQGALALVQNCPEGNGEICLASAGGNTELSFYSPPLDAGQTYYVHISSSASNPELEFCLESAFGPAGCTNSLAQNYDPIALVDDGSCLFSDPFSSCAYNSSGLPGDIPDGGFLLDSIFLNVSGNNIVQDLDLALSLHHTYLPDLRISLISPSGQEVPLIQDQCPGQDSFYVRLDDASQAWDCNTISGGYLAPPDGLLSTFDGETAAGYWVLKIEDDALGDEGVLDSWCLIPELEEVDCFSPSGILADNLTATSVTLSWTEGNQPPASEWELELVALGQMPSGEPTLTGISENPYLLEGLQPAQTYEVYLRSVCGPVAGAWSAPRQFTTAISNPSFCGLDIPVADCGIPALTRFPLNVSSAPGSQLGQDVFLKEVRLIIEHEYASDLDVFLTSPNGVEVELTTDNGGGDPNYGIPGFFNCQGATVFSQEACRSIDDDSNNPPFLGAFLPEGNLSDFYDGSSPLGNWTLSVCDDAGDDSGTLEYIELVFDSLLCSAPDEIQVDSTGAGSVFLSWPAGGSCTQYILEYGPPGFIPGNGLAPGSPQSQVTLLPCNSSFPVFLEGLEESTLYELVIRKECSPGLFSVNGCPVNFITDCNSGPRTSLETFDEEELCSTTCGEDCPLLSTQWYNAANDDFDWIVDELKTPSSRTGPDDDITGGGKYLYIETSKNVCPDGGKASLISGCLEVDADEGSCHFSFYYHMYGDDINRLVLLASRASEIHWDTLWSIEGEQGQRWFKTYADLSAYHGDTIQLRLDGYKGFGVRGDLAIDHLAFYGSTDLGFPSQVYYADQDGDGFGNGQDSVFACGPFPPTGYVSGKSDCDDNDPAINPLAEEIPCNQVDENCNGPADDPVLPIPQLSPVTVCAGGLAELSPVQAAEGKYFWKFDSSDAPVAGMGGTFAFLADTSRVVYVIDSIQENGYLCRSEWAPVIVTALAQPELKAPQQLIRCPGQALDLATVDVVDLSGSGAPLDFYLDYPGGAPIDPPQIMPSGEQTIYIKAETQEGCFDVDSFLVKVFDPPEVSISPEGPLTLCSGKPAELEVSWNSESDSIAILWSNGFQESEVLIFGSPVPGTETYYWVEITDEGGCTGRDSIQVQTTESISTASVDAVYDVSSCNGNDGAMVISPLNGIPPYDYQWSGPVSGAAQDVDSTIVINGLSQGAYRVTLTDASSSGCALIIPLIVVSGPSSVVNSIQIKDVSCAGAQDGGIFMQILGGTPAISWNTGDTTPVLENLAGGLYSVTIQDGACTLTLEELLLEEPDSLSLFNAQVQDASCSYSSDGEIQATAQGGNGSYLYQWSTGSFDTGIDQLAPGAYSLTVSDQKGCMRVDSFRVNRPDSLYFIVDSIQHVACAGFGEGAIFVTASGGTSPYSYQWSSGATAEDLTDLPAGLYSLEVTDSRGCIYQGAGLLIDEPPPLEMELVSIQDASCNTAADGSLEVSVIGGISPYQVNWSHGDTGTQVDNLAPGEYSVSASDAAGCQTSLSSISVDAPEVLSIQLSQVLNPSCEGRTDGSVSLSVSGGAPPYDYYWNTGAGTQSINNLDAGAYTCTVTDANGCFALLDTVQLTTSQVLNGTIDFVNDLTCFQSDDGQIFITITGGMAPYQYAWSDSSVLADRQELPPGKYDCTITDSKGCRMVLPVVEVDEPPPLTITLNSVEPVLCNGLANGSIDVVVSGGIPPYQYSWDDGSALEDLQEAPAGIYKLTVLDKNACLASLDSLVLPQPPPISVLVAPVLDEGCAGNTGGSADISVSGGLPPYDYQWSNGETQQDLVDVPPGTYALTITDANECESVRPAIPVPEPLDSMQIVADSLSPISCFNAKDGQIHLSIQGGALPYQYLWNIGIDSTLSLTGLSPGNYKITVTDGRGCTSVSPFFNLASPAPLSVLIDGIEEPACPGEAGGGIFSTPNGGVGSYQFVWYNAFGDTVALSEDPEGLPAGGYFAQVVDANGCSALSNSISIPEPENVSILLQDTLASCTGDSTGEVNVFIEGGQAPYTFSWNNGAATEDLIDVPPGIYQLTLTDANNCTYVSEIFPVTALSPMPLGLTLDSLLPVACFGEKTGYAEVTPAGGAPPYAYSWNNGSPLSFIKNVVAGTYFCTVTDANGCTLSSGPVPIHQPAEALSYAQDSLLNVSCPAGNDGAVYLSTIGGTSPYTYQWSHAVETEDAPGLMSGTYRVTITDVAGCTLVSAFFTIGQPLPFEVEVDMNPSSNGHSDGSAALQVSGATPPYDYLWDPLAGGQTTAFADSLEAGLYYVTVTDANSCDTIVEVFVESASSLSGRPETAGNLLLYPNPAKDRVMVEWDGNSGGLPSRIQFFDAVGRRIGTFVLSGRLTELNLSALPPGTYFFRIPDTSIVGKLILLKE